MTIEIRELVIKANVAASSGEQVLSTQALAQLKQSILQDCLEKVMDKLQEHMSHGR